MLSSGIPGITEYSTLETIPEYTDLQASSREFLRRRPDNTLSSRLYGLKWVQDPFSQWSRKWEYLYTFQRLEKWLDKYPRDATIVDAGSGFTFFPFHIQHHFPSTKVLCIDADPTAGSAIEEASRVYAPAPHFSLEDLEKLRLQSASVDVVYSVSVIEHTKDPLRVIDEIHRVLKPNGMFICTFDISFEEKSPMYVKRVVRLVEKLAQLFEPEPGRASMDIADACLDDGAASDMVTTGWIGRTTDASSLPWRYPRLVWLYDLLRGRARATLYRPMTYYCGTYFKK